MAAFPAYLMRSPGFDPKLCCHLIKNKRKTENFTNTWKLSCTHGRKPMNQGGNDKNDQKTTSKFTGCSENPAEWEIYHSKCLH